MDRRHFLRACALTGGMPGLTAFDAAAAAPPKLYARVLLVDSQGLPVRSRSLKAHTSYVFNYPYASTPCFLLDLGGPITRPATLRRHDGERYQWSGGVGSRRSIVAFSAICAHKLAYPTRDISFIRYQAARSSTSEGNVIHCCADHSVYDPAAGAAVVSGPAPQPLAAILLDHDPARDEFRAVGTQGAEQFAAFFEKYDFRLRLEYGPERSRALVERTAVVLELARYCRQTVEC